MELGLCMIVKDEENTIEGCLDGVFELFDEMVIVDNGSTDKTPHILRNRYNIEPICQEFNAQFPEKRFLRNLGYSTISTPWIFVLDADERVDPEELERFRRHEPDTDNCGFFFRWDTFSNGTVVEDYKLSSFRKSIRSSGLVHETVQSDFRRQGKQALWYGELKISHYPDETRFPEKLELYVRHLLQGIEREPEWSRYHWFLGYTYFRNGRSDEAWEYLEFAANNSSRFPVEALNARIVLTDMHARQGKLDSALNEINAALDFFKTCQDDFEVKVNFRLKPWLESAREHCLNGCLDEIRAYAFSH
jgi:glycosyltransferase involved in cell wall biosynthesis